MGKKLADAGRIERMLRVHMVPALAPHVWERRLQYAMKHKDRIAGCQNLAEVYRAICEPSGVGRPRNKAFLASVLAIYKARRTVVAGYRIEEPQEGVLQFAPVAAEVTA